MGRHKQPLELAKLKGADKYDPQRYKDTPPKNKHGLGDPPAHMTEQAKEIWYELLSHSLPGVATASERFILIIAWKTFYICKDMSVYVKLDYTTAVL